MYYYYYYYYREGTLLVAMWQKQYSYQYSPMPNYISERSETALEQVGSGAGEHEQLTLLYRCFRFCNGRKSIRFFSNASIMYTYRFPRPPGLVPRCRSVLMWSSSPTSAPDMAGQSSITLHSRSRVATGLLSFSKTITAGSKRWTKDWIFRNL